MKRTRNTRRIARSALLAACVVSTSWVALAAEPALRNPIARTSYHQQEEVAVPVADGPLTLETLEGMALAGNPSIARAQALVSAARGNWLQVGLPPNPQFGYQGQQLGSEGLAEQHGAMAQQEIVRGGKLRLNRAVAAQEVSRAQQELATQQQRVITDVRIAFIGVLVAQRQLEMTNELVTIAERGSAAAEALFNAKEVGRSDVLQAELEVENARILAQNARNRVSSSWQQLSAIIGRPRMSPQEVAGDLTEEHETLEWSATVERLLATSPELAVASANIERARWNLERQLVEPRPNVTVQGLVNWRDNGVGGRSDGGIQVMLPLPTWNKNQGAIAQAQCEIVAAQRALEQLELSLQQRLAPTFERYNNARNQVKRYQERILPAAEENLDLARKTYAAGESGYVNLLTAQRTFSQTRLNYLDALRELRSAETEIEGLLLTSSLEAR
jgi:cobalt-zinc-cadmium efflux system outer membrane protein